MRRPENMPWQIRQGDVLLIHEEVPAGAVEIPRAADGRIVLAAGEATGHHHAISDPSVKLFHQAAEDRRFVQVTREHARGGGEIAHEEHTALPQGTALRTSRVVRQREWTSAMVRRVTD